MTHADERAEGGGGEEGGERWAVVVVVFVCSLDIFPAIKMLGLINTGVAV